MSGPTLPYAEELHAMKYRQPGETFRDAMGRVAAALVDDPGNAEEYHELRELLLDQRFMPAGRVQAAMGAGREVTPYNCYVSGTIPDSFTSRDNVENSSIMHRAEQAATTMRMGGGIGYDFSTLRPKGDLIRKLSSHSSGPISFMKIFNEVCLCTSSAGHRRGAQMGVLRVDHPDIIDFVNTKHDNSTLRGFNMSIAVTDEFMEAREKGTTFQMRFGGKAYGEMDARELWEMIMRSTWDWAEPGVLFIDTINKMNNLWYCETIAATNPCGEQPLPPFGACLLGSFNLAKYIRVAQRTPNNEFYFSWDQLSTDIPRVVRAMDNIVDRARYPLAEQEQEAKNKRRMGLGVTALANAAEALGYPYGSPSFLAFQEKVLAFIANNSYRASAMLAKEKGAFKLYDAERYSQGRFIAKLDEEVRDLIKKYGIRNSHLTSVAPTGTISMAADNVSSGIEPVFELETMRPVNTPEGQQIVTLPDYGYRVFGVKGRLASQVTASEHVSVLGTAAKWVDSAVSKTCNVDGNMQWADFKGIYETAWELGAKGCTTFNQDGKRMALLTGKKPEKASEDETATTVCEIDPETGRRSCE
jgi:ribonucleoside-diphosphate reductase alpha chain